MGENLTEIKSYMDIILDTGSSYATLTDAVEGIRKSFTSLIIEDGLAILSSVGEKKTNSGIALDPLGALNCISDVLRSVKFMRGINSAILHLQTSSPDTEINIVYAGCGPFASLLVPLATVTNLKKIKIFLIDINEESLQSVEQIIRNLGLPEGIFNYICADASSHRFNPEIPLHLIISETMLSALNKEPQVPITLNLASQLCENGILIPQEISINAFLADPAEEFAKYKGENSLIEAKAKLRTELGEVFTLSLEKVREYLQANSGIHTKDSAKIKAGEFTLPAVIGENDLIMLETTIVVYDDIVLNEYESGLTHPYIYNGEYDKKPGGIMKFYYEISDYPRFVIDRQKVNLL